MVIREEKASNFMSLFCFVCLKLSFYLFKSVDREKLINRLIFYLLCSIRNDTVKQVKSIVTSIFKSKKAELFTTIFPTSISRYADSAFKT